METLFNESKHVEASTDNLESLLDWARALLEQAGFPPKTCYQITVVIEEVFGNICCYAYPGASGTADINLSFDGETLTLRLEDSGIPFNPLEREDPDITASIEDRPIGGLGIFITKKWMDETHYERKDGKNVLVMRRKG
jgi:anti-sigma regulatory factor (Ser/Thr protein kinase)